MKILSYNNYLTNIDLVYRYKTNSLYKIPNFQKLNIKLNAENFHNFLKSFLDSNSKINVIKSNLFLFFYLIFSRIPFCDFSYRKETILKLNIASNKQIHSFLFEFFYTKYKKAIGFLFDKKLIKNEKINLNLFFSTKKIIDLNQIFIKKILKINNKEDLELLLYLTIKN